MRKITKSLLTLALLVAGVGVANAQTPFAFDALGKATIAKEALVGAGGLTYNSATGELSSDGTEGTLTLEFTEPVDLRNLKHFNVTNSGQTNDILSRLEFYDEDNKKINTWNSIKLSNTWNPAGIDDNATNAFLNNKPVKKMVWPSDANASNNGKTATITSVEFICKTIACAKAGEVVLKSLPYQNMDGTTATPTWNVSFSTDTYYGTTEGTNAVSYTDITEYSELRIYRNDNTGFRAFFINAAGTKVNNINHENAASSWNAEGKYWSIDLSKVEKYNEKVALQSIKSAGWGQNNIVNNIVVYKTPTANTPQYSLSGSGMQLAETVAVLADATVTCIDATGVTGITTNSEAGRTLLTSANPNCLFLGTTGNGGLANTKNVITSGTCDNLELVDGKPFKAPSDFTATNAKFTKTFTDAKCGTMVIPFAAALPSGIEAYDLTGVDGTKITHKDAVSIAANAPVLLKSAAATSYEFTATSVAIAATVDESTNGKLIGTYVGTKAAADANNYVLQNGGAGLGFFKVTGTDATVKPFRAYLNTDALASQLVLDFGDVTGINAAELVKKVGNETFYNLNGQRVAQPAKGLYIVNGKKIVVK